MSLTELSSYEDLPEESKAIVDGYKKAYSTDVIPPMFSLLGPNPNMFKAYMEQANAIMVEGSVPSILKQMIFLSVASAKNCIYCTTQLSAVCKMSGVDEEMIKNLTADVNSVSPKKTKQVISFAVKSALDPHSIKLEDVEGLKAEGIDDAELLEISSTVAFSLYSIAMADIYNLEENLAG